MRQVFIWSMTAMAVLTLPVHAQDKYVGAKICAQCHATDEPGNAFHLWQTSKHAGAYKTLETHTESEARTCGDLELWIVEIGRGVSYGLPRPAVESKECLPCHVTAFGAGAPLIAPSFDPRDGVQCESCHGPGSAHADAMASHDPVKTESTLKHYEDDRAIERRCLGCHEGTCGDFEFATMWPMIRHSRPRGR